MTRCKKQPWRHAALLLCGWLLLCSAHTARAQQRSPEPDIAALLAQAHAKFKSVTDGENADYIPALAEVPSELFAIALVTAEGYAYAVGDVDTPFSIQSISKVFTLARVIEERGAEAIEKSVGVDATGQVFNSVVAVEAHRGREQNPLVNPGAIATTGMVSGATAEQKWQRILATYEDFAGRKLDVNQPVYESEAATNQRNQAIAMLMHAYELLPGDPAMVTDLYTKQCSVNVTARDLAAMAATLANGGRNPVTHVQAVSTTNVPRILAVMATAGLYDDSGLWLYRVGLPAKSGVGGGIIAVAPGRFGIAAFSPRLDAAGNSVRAQLAIRYVAEQLGANPYASVPK